MRFSIRDLLWATALVAMGMAWWSDHGWQEARYAELERSAYPDRDFNDLKAAYDKLLQERDPRSG